MKRLTIVADFEDDVSNEAIQQEVSRIGYTLSEVNRTYNEGSFLKRATLEHLREGDYTNLLE